jgi:hypothetical protein
MGKRNRSFGIERRLRTTLHRRRDRPGSFGHAAHVRSDSVGYAVAASSSGFLEVWSEGTGDSTGLVAEPFDEDGHSTGPSSPFGNASGNIIALATAPGGDLLAAWDGASESAGNVYVQAVSADGTPEGTPTLLGSIMSPEQDLFVVASPLGGMVLYENDTPSYAEVFGVPLRCADR